MSETDPAQHSQTLSRGLRILEILADADEPLTIARLAEALGVHRSIAYRLLRTLESHRVVVRDAGGRFELGPRLAALARGVQHDLQAAALPELTKVAGDLGMTAFLAVLDRREVVTLVSVEPAHALATVTHRPGTRHPLASGAPGIAIQSALTDPQRAALGQEFEVRTEAADARTRGFATSQDEVIPGLRSIAVPLAVPEMSPAAVAVVYVASDRDPADIGRRLRLAATDIARALT